ncbi:MAG: beta-N-acetylhexosaminidase, partial [Candidatus Odyssella sp.]|nr:beta-N-acetylhexosaminidase [Candidatus Odyssella sp.]
MAASKKKTPSLAAAIFGCAGMALSKDERAFFRTVRPAGFILFGRNIETPAQVKALVADLRKSSGVAHAPVLIDQEGGRVARLRPPHWRHPPPAAVFGRLYERDPKAALEACRLNARLIAHELLAMGVDVDCAPVLDVPQPGSHDIVGDRALAREPYAVAALGLAWCQGFAEGGVAPVIKHIPGHGRARADSHLSLPEVGATWAELAAADFAPFKALADQPWAMTAHVLYTALDKAAPATTSRAIVEDVIRGHIGFSGALMSDDLSMKALAGSFELRARECRAAGCDIALHCNGNPDEMAAVALGAGALEGESLKR